MHRYYEAHADAYDGWMRIYDRRFLGGARRALCERAHGRTLEVGVGTGLNLPDCPTDVEVVAVDYSERMLEHASRRAKALGREVTLLVADGHAMPFPDASFDTVVSTLVFSSLPDPMRAASEVHRVLRPGGEFLIIDHVRSNVFPIRVLERVTAGFVAKTTGVHLLRDPVDYLPGLGFVIEDCRRTSLGFIETVVARKP